MKKFFLISVFLVALSACTFPGQDQEITSQEVVIPVEHNFQNDYQRHVVAVFDQLENIRSDYLDFVEKFSPSGFDNSTIRFAGNIANIGSGEIQIHADAVRNSRDMTLSADIDASGFIDSEDSLIRLDSLKGSFVSWVGTYYMKLDEFKISGRGTEYESMKESFNEMMQKMAPNLGKWIEYNSFLLTKNFSSGEAGPTQFVNNILPIILGVEIDVLSGGNKTRTILMQHPPLRVTNSLGQEGEYYRYAVTLDQTGVLDMVNSFSETFVGTGVQDEDRLREQIASISLSGIISIHESKSEYFKFDGEVSSSGKEDRGHLDITFDPNSSHFIVHTITGEGQEEVFAYRGKTTDTTGQYTFSSSGRQMASFDTTHDDVGLTGLDGFIGLDKNQTQVMYDFKNHEDFSFSLTNSGTDIIRAQGKMQEKRLVALDGTITVDGTQTVHVIYKQEEDGTISGTIESSEFPQAIELSGHAKKDDIELTLQVQGISVTFSHQKKSDGTFVGSFRLPVAMISWNGKESEDFLEFLKANVTSPFVKVALDMQMADGWLTGPLKITQSNETKNSMVINLKAKREDKDFAWRLDIPENNFVSNAIHLEWDSHIDVRWDKNAKVNIPESAISIFDAFPEFRDALIPKATPSTDIGITSSDGIFDSERVESFGDL